MKFVKFLRAPILKNVCERLSASPIWNMACEFIMTWSFSSTVRNSKSNSEAYFYVSLCEINCTSKFRQWARFWTYFSKDSVWFIYFDIIIGQRQKRKFKLVELFFQSREWSKDMWYCATTNIAHAQGSYLTVAQLWRSALILKRLGGAPPTS